MIFGTKSVVVFKSLMMIPNLIGVVVMCPLVFKITKNYVDRKRKHKDVQPIYSYDPTIQKMAEEFDGDIFTTEE